LSVTELTQNCGACYLKDQNCGACYLKDQNCGACYLKDQNCGACYLKDQNCGTSSGKGAKRFCLVTRVLLLQAPGTVVLGRNFLLDISSEYIIM
jgi:hypothetical protein